MLASFQLVSIDSVAPVSSVLFSSFGIPILTQIFHFPPLSLSSLPTLFSSPHLHFAGRVPVLALAVTPVACLLSVMLVCVGLRCDVVPACLRLLEFVVAFTWLGIFFGSQHCLPSSLLEFFARRELKDWSEWTALG